MASLCGTLCCLLFCILAISNQLPGILATDSEIVEAETDGQPSATDLNEASRPKMEPMWNASGAMLVQPYNILEVSCPQGYVLANKHCHKRV
ncbi:hypothetical protein KR009_006967 [Drosophila setifemur]|nr:hypothetical protein KR009_006967 [Drosophila setifemur]